MYVHDLLLIIYDEKRESLHALVRWRREIKC